jgi:hypothetical protein
VRGLEAGPRGRSWILRVASQTPSVGRIYAFGVTVVEDTGEPRVCDGRWASSVRASGRRLEERELGALGLGLDAGAEVLQVAAGVAGPLGVAAQEDLRALAGLPQAREAGAIHAAGAARAGELDAAGVRVGGVPGVDLLAHRLGGVDQQDGAGLLGGFA